MLEWMEAPGPSKQQVRARGRRFLTVLENKAGNLDQEGEEDSDGDDIIWPSSQEFFQDLKFVLQEESSSSSSMGTESEGQEDNYQQSTFPESLELMDMEPAGSARARALEKEGHHLPLAPVAEQKAKAPACLAFSELDTAVEAESLAPVPSSPAEDDLALVGSDHFIVREFMAKAVLVTQGPDQQSTEQQDFIEGMGNQAEPSTAFGSLVAQEAEGTSSPLADTGTPHHAPSAQDEGEATASPLCWDPQHQVASETRGDTQPSSSPRDTPKAGPGTSLRRGQAWPSIECIGERNPAPLPAPGGFLEVATSPEPACPTVLPAAFHLWIF
ncbi:uncharacterized protein [Heliangelus exortis]|uniref:uncharacterized protein n=1 Tax=Heliangelus exortis TaxID=472823 RepID=UPI003A8F54AF